MDDWTYRPGYVVMAFSAMLFQLSGVMALLESWEHQKHQKIPCYSVILRRER